MFGAIALAVDFIGYLLSLHTLPEELRVISYILLAGIPVIVIGILLWTAIVARKEARAEKPKIELIPAHLPIRGKDGNTVGIEQFYDMNISTLDCLKYKTLMAELSPISFWSKEESGHALLSPPIVLWCKENVKANSLLRKKDIFHFWSTTKQMIIANQHQVKLNEGVEYETNVEVKDDKKTLFKKQYLMRLAQHAEFVGLVIEEVEVYELGGSL